ncbi:MAG: PqiC family protein, partial [Burkholderiaceae bacterium]|nr:PqiC family protein [Burkholderiaceae bacterium]
PDGATRLVEAERWSEPLKHAIPRVLATSLMDRLPAVAVWSSGAAGPTRPDAKLDLEIIEWRSELGGTVSVDVLWHLRRGEESRAGRTRSRVRAEDASFPALVAAQRNAVTTISDDIAPALRALLQKSHR